MAERNPPRSGKDRPRSSRGPAGGARSGPAGGARTGSAGSGSTGSRAGTGRAATSRSGGPRTGPTRGTQRGAKPGSKPGGKPGPGKERPALSARPRTKPPEPPSQSTTWVRTAILLGIVVMLAVTLVPTLRSVIQQRNDTVALQDKVAQQKLTVAELEKQAALWKDPSFIEEQARARLKFVRVGDRAYSVIGADKVASDQAPNEDPVVAAPMANEAAPWYGKVWQSIQIADRPTAGLAR